MVQGGNNNNNNITVPQKSTVGNVYAVWSKNLKFIHNSPCLNLLPPRGRSHLLAQGFSGKVAGTRNLSFSCRKIKNELAAAPVSIAIHGQAYKIGLE